MLWNVDWRSFGGPCPQRRNEIDAFKECQRISRYINLANDKWEGNFMKQYESKNLIEDLRKLVEQDVKHYQSDFQYDQEMFLEGLEKGERDFIWMTRESGTQCLSEKNAYLQETSGNYQCHFHLPNDDVKAYFVHLDSMENGNLTGSFYPVNKEQLLEHIDKNEVHAGSVEILPSQGDSFVVSYEEYAKECFGYGEKYGDFSKKYFPREEDAARLDSALRENRKKREQAKAGSLSELSGKKSSLLEQIQDAKEKQKDTMKTEGKQAEKEFCK